MKPFLILTLVCLSFCANAQNKLVFTNTTDTSKTVTVKQKDLARLAYNGYMKQAQEVEGYVANVTDSSITLSPRKKLFKKQQLGQTILIRDITGFKRYASFRPAAETIYSIAGVGITGAVSAIISKASVPVALTFLSAAGTQTVTMAIKKVFFPSKIKNHLGSGWTMKLQKN